MRHPLLKQDYQELQREIRALKKRIQRAKLKKEYLLGVVRVIGKSPIAMFFLSSSEIRRFSPPRPKARSRRRHSYRFGMVFTRFLRRRYKMLKGMNSEEPARKSMAYESGPDTSSMDRRHEPATRAISIQEEKAAPIQEIDQERYLTLDGCEKPEIRGTEPLVARDIDVFSEPPRTAAPALIGSFKKKSLIESNELVSALKSSNFKDSPNGLISSKRSGKRKISWQDEAPLKV